MDSLEIKEISVFSNVRKNPYADKLRKSGYSIIINISPEDIAAMTKHSIEKIQNISPLDLDPDELEALEKYRKANQI